MNDEYISIKEFAKRANVSVQSLYKRLNGLNNPLNQFIKLVDNQKMLNIKALTEIYSIEVEQPIQPNHSTYSTLDSTPDHLNEAVIETLLNQSEILKRELEQKNEQLKEKDRQIEKLQTLLDQEQQLHALTAQQKKEIPEQMEADSEERKHWWKWWR